MRTRREHLLETTRLFQRTGEVCLLRGQRGVGDGTKGEIRSERVSTHDMLRHIFETSRPGFTPEGGDTPN